MNKLIIFILTIFLTGCVTFSKKPDQELIVKYKYIVTEIPAELLVIPAPMYKINPKTATDKDAAQWLIDSEKRFLEIEKKLQAIKAYLDKKLKELNIPENDLIKN